jgi:hypothetical protein
MRLPKHTSLGIVVATIHFAASILFYRWQQGLTGSEGALELLLGLFLFPPVMCITPAPPSELTAVVNAMVWGCAAMTLASLLRRLRRPRWHKYVDESHPHPDGAEVPHRQK